MGAIERFKKIQAEQEQGGFSVKFRYDGQYSEDLSAQEGRPIYKCVEVFEMRAPSEPMPRVVMATPQHKQNFPEAYRAFKSQEEPFKDGTLLKEWSLLPLSTMLELTGLGIRTVEELAAADSIDAIAGLFPKEIETAKQWMDNAKAPKNIATTLGKKVKELEELIETYRNQIATLHKQALDAR